MQILKSHYSVSKSTYVARQGIEASGFQSKANSQFWGFFLLWHSSNASETNYQDSARASNDWTHYIQLDKNCYRRNKYNWFAHWFKMAKSCHFKDRGWNVSFVSGKAACEGNKNFLEHDKFFTDNFPIIFFFFFFSFFLIFF